MTKNQLDAARCRLRTVHAQRGIKAQRLFVERTKLRALRDYFEQAYPPERGLDARGHMLEDQRMRQEILVSDLSTRYRELDQEIHELRHALRHGATEEE